MTARRGSSWCSRLLWSVGHDPFDRPVALTGPVLENQSLQACLDRALERQRRGAREVYSDRNVE